MRPYLSNIVITFAKYGAIVLAFILGVSSSPNQIDSAQATGSYDTVALRFDLYAPGINLISSLDFADNGRLYMAHASGKVQIVEVDGTINPTDFLDLRSQVGNSGKQALSGFVLHPQFESNGTFFVNYTNSQNLTFLSKFQTMVGDPDQADPNSEEILLTMVQPTDIHNGAGMVFGPDGYLYFGMGDGGYYDDPDNNSQNGNTYLGAIMRVDVDGPFPYAIPPDNPFIGDPNVLDEIWAMGVRNPWRFDFDSATGDLYIADVGGTLWEEIDFEPAGSGGGFNYGWRCYQGFAPHILEGCGPAENYTFPVYVRAHSSMCAIIGGHVYRGSAYPMMDGHFLFADFCSGRTRGLLRQPDGSFVVASTGKIEGGIVSTFGEDPNGELYIVANSSVYKISAETVTLTPQAYLPSIHFGQ